MKFLRVLFFSTIIITLSTCKKYPDGGYISRGPKMLLKHDGVWYLDKYIVNDIDSTELINFNNDPEKKYKKIIFMKTSKYGGSIVVNLYPTKIISTNFSESNYKFTFLLSEDTVKKGTYCYLNNPHYSGCYRWYFMPEGAKTEWTIERLTRKEMTLTLTLTNKYLIKLSCKD